MYKDYQVFYVIKSGGREELNHMFVRACSRDDAFDKVREQVRLKRGKTAFRCTLKKPYKAFNIKTGRYEFTI